MAAALWWRIAWRNLWRNPRRTLITAAALALGFLASVLMVAISDGMVAEMVENGTGLTGGQIEVQAPGYRRERSVHLTIGGDAGTDVAALARAIAAEPGVTGAAPRVFAGGLVSAGRETAAAMLTGVDPALEPRVSRLLATLTEGRVPHAGAREILLGAGMARTLGVGPGAEVVVVAPAADGSLGNDLYRVAGVFRTGAPAIDGAQAVLPIGALQALIALAPGRVHELAVAVADPWTAPAVAGRLRARLGGLAAPPAVVPWTVFRPELAGFAELAHAANGLIVLIVFLMAVFGVANTMLMGTYERRREFAVVRALGSPPLGVVRTVLLEGVALGLVALLAGAALTAPLLAWWQHAPPDLGHLFGEITMAGALVRPLLRAEFSWQGPLLAAAGLLGTALAAALVPALQAARVPPADALAGR